MLLQAYSVGRHSAGSRKSLLANKSIIGKMVDFLSSSNLVFVVTRSSFLGKENMEAKFEQEETVDWER